MASCRECKLYDLDAVKDKAGRVRRDWAAKCLWVSTETLPASVLEGMHGYKRPQAGLMEPDQGQRCKRFIKREDTPRALHKDREGQ